MRSLRHVTLAAGLLAIFFITPARAQVMDQVPANAVAVFKVKNLSALNAKVVKTAQAWGVDQMAPDFKDPLASLMQKAHITEGVNKEGDLAIAGFEPKEVDAKPNEAMIILVPVSDYKAFVGNFKEPQEADGITHAKSPEARPDGKGEDLYIAHWGAYAAVTPTQSLLNQKPSGIKLTGQAAKESETRDVILYGNIDAIRKTAIPKLKEERQKVLDEFTKNLGNDEQSKKFEPVFRVVVDEYMNGVEQFLNDATIGMLSLNLDDDGISTAAIADFKPGSEFGKTVSELKGNGNGPLLAGLPDRKYFAFGGAAIDPKVAMEIWARVVDPVTKQLAATGEEGKKLADLLEIAKSMVGAVKSTTFGYVMPTGALGKESVVQTVVVMTGDAAAIAKDERQLVEGFAGFMKQAMAAQPNGGGLDFQFTPHAKTIDGVVLDSYTMNLKMDPNDPKAAQAQQVIGMIYGPNGMGGSWGAVNADTFIAVAGGTDGLISEAIAAAKNPQDHLSGTQGVKTVSAHLPKARILEYYVAVDNIVASVAKAAAGLGFPIKLRLPPNLPPIGVAAATEGTSVRVESFVPSSLVESMIAAGIEAYTNFKGGPNGAGGPGGL